MRSTTETLEIMAMLLGLITDIHANMPALEACLRRCETYSVTRYFVLGDVVGYGADPEPVARLVMQMAERGAVVLRGNHDAAVDEESPNMNDVAFEAIRWTRRQLSEGAKNFLRSLPLTHEETGCVFVHSEASAPERFRYVTGTESARVSLEATSSEVTFCGHVHVPQLYCLTGTGKVIGHKPVDSVPVSLLLARKWLAVIGACGQPRDGNPAAAFAIFNTETRELTFRRAPYDAEAAAARIRAVGLPERLAARLLVGY